MESWDDILTAHGPAAYRAAWRVLGHAADAEDAVQDALVDGLRLYRRGVVACWAGLLRKLCVRRALDRLRRRRPVVPLPA
ncbi:MAG TPA: sigma factor, partial [Urbifossiella sp.]|nr:sigma factor [Urbifossiella sp.]